MRIAHSTAPPDPLAKLITSRPIDATAARVVASGPKGYESSKKTNVDHSEAPIPTRPVPGNAIDLTGHRIGLFTVIGLSVKAKRWACRCVCGRYELRTAKAIRNARNSGDRCGRCRNVMALKRTSEYQQLGYHPDEQDEGGC